MLSHWNYFLLNFVVKKIASSLQAAFIFLPTFHQQNAIFCHTQKKGFFEYFVFFMKLHCVSFYSYYQRLLFTCSFVAASSQNMIMYSFFLRKHEITALIFIFKAKQDIKERLCQHYRWIMCRSSVHVIKLCVSLMFLLAWSLGNASLKRRCAFFLPGDVK